MPNNKVHNTHISALLPELHRSLIDITVIMNQPERDVELLAKAGLSLERALFPLLVLVERFGPIGVVDLAGRVGRDYTTVSRQVARLEELGLVKRRPSSADKRIREAIVTAAGKEATDALDAAREEMTIGIFADWERKDFDDLVRLMRKLVETMY
ncbi:MarR family winged helix-turn-helix transcriptional regulator [Sphingopyxis sp. MSC1_008]|uniref:MarR family winged helix-turn-helix transcriptional regulator n=1 Tax=Sphingopyxis sp. MSC1_008 TaxID=2909265 RepID=UPI0020BFE792